jgi:LPXTG-motif cell wall-anchored protein
MEPQSITQTINVQIGDVVNGASSTLANTGSSTIAFIAIGLSLIATSLLIWHFGFRRTNRKLSFAEPRVICFCASGSRRANA